MRDSSQPRADVATVPDHQKMPFISPVAHQRRHKKQKSKIQKKEPDIPAISELKECLVLSKRDCEDLFESYGKIFYNSTILNCVLFLLRNNVLLASKKCCMLFSRYIDNIFPKYYTLCFTIRKKF